MRIAQMLAGLAVLFVAVHLCVGDEISSGWESVDAGGGGLRVAVSFTPDGQHGWNVGIGGIGHTSDGGRS